MRNILIIGVHSTIAQKLYEQLSADSNNIVYTTSRTEFDNKNHQIIAPLDDELNMESIPEELHELYYFPGSINLKPFSSLRLKHFQNDLNINVLGFVNILNQVIKPLINGNGSVVAFSSVAASIGLQYHASVSLSKGALEGFIKAMAAEYIGKVRFNSVALSLSDTQMAERLLNSDSKKELAEERNPMNKIGEPNKIASFAKFINSNTNDWMTGETLHLDGGMKSIKVFK